MTILFFLGDWLLILSLMLLIVDRYRTYMLIPQLERPQRTALGLAVTTFLTVILIAVAISSLIFSYTSQYFSFIIYIISFLIWVTASLWKVSNAQANQRHYLFLLSNIFAAIGFLLLLGLLLLSLIQKIK